LPEQRFWNNLGSIMKKIAVISGASNGIGRATAELFAKNKYKVYSLDIEKPVYKNDCIHYLSCDIANIQSINKSVQEIIALEKHIDVLVSNAGVHLSANIENTTEEDYNRVININLTGTFFLLKAVLPHMRQRKRGRIILVGSDQSFIGKVNSAVYGLTKAAIAQLAKSTALDYAPYGILVNCVCPGTIDTPFYRNAIKKHSEIAGIPLAEIEKEENAAQPIGRVGNPEEVASMIYFLSTDGADFITGGLFPVDGGYTAR
jgi:NAD(P)-dependent dehydrogenase (short-subunit alcohol dehydrogenase family)